MKPPKPAKLTKRNPKQPIGSYREKTPARVDRKNLKPSIPKVELKRDANNGRLISSNISGNNRKIVSEGNVAGTKRKAEEPLESHRPPQKKSHVPTRILEEKNGDYDGEKLGSKWKIKETCHTEINDQGSKGTASVDVRPLSPGRALHISMIKYRFAELIYKSQSILKDRKDDHEWRKREEKDRLEKEKLLQEKAQFEAEFKTLQTRHRQKEREAARKAIESMKQTVVIDEKPSLKRVLESINCGYLYDDSNEANEKVKWKLYLRGGNY